MKKIFDFKSSNTEYFIMDKILKFIEKKIPNSIVALLLTIVVGVSMIGLSIGFFVMPFISYSSMALKIVFSVLWGLSCVVFVCAIIDQYKQEKKNEKWIAIITSVCFIIFFGLCFVNNNYYHLGDWWQIAIVVAMGLYTALMLYWFIKELMKNPKGTLSALLMGVLFVFGFLCILSSSLNSLEMDLRKEILVVGTICIAFPVIAILIAKILKISKAEKVLEYGSLIILCILLLMGISYVISFLNPNVDGYQTFVTLFASFIGGGLTLIGVAWTIRRQDKDRMDEQREKAKPFFGIVDMTNTKTKDAAINCIECLPKGEPNVSFCLSIGFENSDKAPFFLDKIKIGNDEFFPDSKLLVSKSMVFSVHILTATGEYNKEEKILLYITDTNYEERIYELIATNENYEAYQIKEYTEEVSND